MIRVQMKIFLLVFVLIAGSVSFAECTSDCNSTPGDSNPTTPPPNTYSNLSDVQTEGIFSQAQEAVKQCQVSYSRCVAPGPEMIDSCAPVMEACIKKAQANLPQ
jgi:hypothetical protein